MRIFYWVVIYMRLIHCFINIPKNENEIYFKRPGSGTEEYNKKLSKSLGMQRIAIFYFLISRRMLVDRRLSFIIGAFLNEAHFLFNDNLPEITKLKSKFGVTHIQICFLS